MDRKIFKKTFSLLGCLLLVTAVGCTPKSEKKPDQNKSNETSLITEVSSMTQTETAKSDITVLESGYKSRFNSDEGKYYSYGALVFENSSTEAKKLVIFRVTFYNSADEVIDSVEPGVILALPGKSAVDFRSSTLEEPARVDVVYSGRSVGSNLSKTFEFKVTGKESFDKFGRMKFVGSVKVPEDYDVIDKENLSDLQVCAIIRDESGKILSGASCIIDNVKAGESAPFDFFVNINDFPKHTTVEYYVTPAEYHFIGS